MKLTEYNKKRDFKKTKEPAGKLVKRGGKEPLVFVIQRHDATREHYDFRLEVNGVLVSWAIPKQPTHDVSVKRLAIRTEDHPWDYLHFEGTIPKGSYGGGTVMVWDTGTYHVPSTDNPRDAEKIVAQSLHKGLVHIVLNGEKLHGEFTLVKMKDRGGDKDQWLFFKNEDEHAGEEVKNPDTSVLTKRTLKQIENGDTEWKNGKASLKKDADPSNSSTLDLKDLMKEVGKLKGAVKASMPSKLSPMLATLTDEAFDDDKWIFEIKYDGYRSLAHIKDGKVDLWSRRGKSFNTIYSPVVTGLKQIPYEMVLDGEVVVLDKKGQPDFHALQMYAENQTGSLVYMAFDLVYFEGYDLKDVTQLERKELLEKVLPQGLPGVRYCEHIVGDGEKFFKLATDAGLEGIIAKRANSHYYAGKRTEDWLKIKGGLKRQEFVIGGYTAPRGSRKHFGSLLLGVYENGKLQYAGKVGTGFNDDTLKAVFAKMKKLERKTSPYDKKIPEERLAHFVKPELIAEIKFTGWTEDRRLRHPVFMGLRTDKTAKKVEKEEPVLQRVIKTEDSDERLNFTNKKKIYFPESSYTKQHVIDYYDRISDYLLPYLKDRPQSLRRNPNGITDEGFFMKNVEGKVPDWIQTEEIMSGSKGEPITYMICNDKATLLFMANWGCIELNPWSSRIGSLENPDYIVFDLDPVDVPFPQIAKVAKTLKKLLDKMEVPAYLKTSGGRGLHVYIPIELEYTYEQTQNFAKLIGMQVRSQLPDLVSLERMPDKRKNQVYVDFLQNAKGKTMSSVYSMRPKAGAPIATPIEWSELDTIKTPSQFNLSNIFPRLEKKGDLWKDMFKHRIRIEDALDKLG